MFHTNRIFILAPHTDDGELGCGATIAKYIAEGKEVFYIAFSTCSQSLPAHLPSNTLAKECEAATQKLNIKKEQLILFDFEVRQLLFKRQEVLNTLLKLNQQYQPQTVFLPAAGDVHQDHQVIYGEGMRAFKNANVLGYELPWNNFKFHPTYFEKLSADNITAKTEALKEYKSQAHRRYMGEEFIRSLAVVRGIQSNTPFAEAFEVYRLSN
ncbi:MAG: LmbE family protein [Chitinophagaceae bacterium]